jgi:hypothetical protein
LTTGTIPAKSNRLQLSASMMYEQPRLVIHSIGAFDDKPRTRIVLNEARKLMTSKSPVLYASKCVPHFLDLDPYRDVHAVGTVASERDIGVLQAA